MAALGFCAGLFLTHHSFSVEPFQTRFKSQFADGVRSVLVATYDILRWPAKADTGKRRRHIDSAIGPMAASRPREKGRCVLFFFVLRKTPWRPT